MEYLAKRSRYDKLLQGISLYGFELLSINHLVRLCSRWLYSHGEKEENNIMVSYATIVLLREIRRKNFKLSSTLF